jgi:hypothetical protein
MTVLIVTAYDELLRLISSAPPPSPPCLCVNPPMIWNRVAGWYVFIPKIPILVHFGGTWNGKRWYTYFMAVWDILRYFGIIYVHLE